GTFGPPSNNMVATGLTQVVSVDVNGDGLTDLLTTVGPANQVRALLQQAAGSFAAGPSFATGTAPNAIAVADLDGDGTADFVVADHGSNQLTVFQRDPAAPQGFRPLTIPVGASPRAVAIGDLDSDGKLDLVTANDAPSAGSITILFQQ